MTLVKRKGNVRLSDPKLFCSWPSGLSRSMPPRLLTFAGMNDAFGCSAAATAFAGTYGTGCYWWGCEWKGRDGTQQDSPPGKTRTPRATPASWGSSSASAALGCPAHGRQSMYLLTSLGIEED